MENEIIIFRFLLAVFVRDFRTDLAARIALTTTPDDMCSLLAVGRVARNVSLSLAQHLAAR
jgi:hypothetical protein